MKSKRFSLNATRKWFTRFYTMRAILQWLLQIKPGMTSHEDKSLLLSQGNHFLLWLAMGTTKIKLI